jgi:thiol-disulfide isomerase/thioredoxin
MQSVFQSRMSAASCFAAARLLHRIHARAPRFFAIALALSSAACTPKVEKAPEAAVFKALAIGDAAPAFTVATLSGDSARVGGTAKQSVTLVNVWATWCGPCKAEFPELQALHVSYAPKGLRLLAISIDTEGEDDAVRKSAQSMGATFAIGRDPTDEVRGRFAAVGIPETWLISADGRLLWRHSGAIPAGDLGVRRAIEAALGTGLKAN